MSGLAKGTLLPVIDLPTVGGGLLRLPEDLQGWWGVVLADAHTVAQALQSYVHDDPAYLESSGFVLDPSGRIVVAVCSSHAIGLLVLDDVRGVVRYRQQLEAA